MAEVFKARAYGAHGFKKVVVVKRILPDMASSQEFRELFINEAKTTVHVSHANIVSVLDLGEIGEELFIALEHVNGVDLSELLKAQREKGYSLSLGSHLHVAIETLKGLHHAHTHFDEVLVHRDVSPSNILVSMAGEVKISDFGIATAATNTRTNVDDGWIMGKVRYMAPEQIANEPLDARTDVYAMGVVLYQMLAGRQPFAGGTDRDVVERIREQLFEPIHEVVPDIPPRLADIVSTAMALDPDDRFDTAQGLRDALADFAYDNGIRPDGRELAGAVREYVQTRRPEKAPEEKSIFERLGPLIADEVSEEGVTSFRKALASETKRVDVPDPLLAQPDELAEEAGSKPSLWPTPDDMPPPSRRGRWAVIGGVLLVLGVAGVAAPRLLDKPDDPVIVEVSPNATVPVSTAAPDAELGSLDIDVSPWAEIFIDGTSVGMTPIEGFELLPGPHEITYLKPDKTRKTIRVQIRAGHRSSLNL